MSYGRRSIRKKGYDYTQPAWYFVTICTFSKQSLFGTTLNAKINLSPVGNIALRTWLEIPNHFKGVHLDAKIFMPDHMHAILNIGEEAQASLSTIIQNYKSVASRKITAFSKCRIKNVWQRNYYEHIIRNEKSLNLIRLYIELNPRMKNEHVELRNIQDLTEEKINEILAPYRDL